MNFIKNIFGRNRTNIEPVIPRDYYNILSEQQQPENSESFQVLSYNLLADNVAYKLIYFHTDYEFLNFQEYRAPRIIEEIKQYMPSIICLQEVDHYEDFYCQQLQNLGYKTYLNKRNKFKPHGTLIGFLQDQWDLLDIENLEYNKAINQKEYKVNSNGITALLKSKKSGKKLCVSSIHTFYRENQVKYAQVAYTTYHIQAFLQKNNQDLKNTSIIIAGDFNAQKNQDIIQYLYGKYPQQKEDRNFHKYKQVQEIYPYTNQDWKLCSAYDFYPNNLQQHITHNMPKSKKEIDFIFFSQNTLEITKLLQPPDEKYLYESKGSPNKYLSSDHLRIQAEFYFK